MPCRKRFPWLWLVIIAFLLVFLAAPALAAGETENLQDQSVNLPEYQPPQVDAGPSMFWLFIRLLLSLLLIIGLTYFGIKVLGKQWGRKSAGTWINILDQMALGQNKGIFITEVAGKVFVLGVTDHSISKLLEIDDQEFIRQMKENPAGEGEPEQFSRQWWQRFLDSWRGRQSSVHPTKPGRGFHQLIEQNLTRLRDLSDNEGKNDDWPQK